MEIMLIEMQENFLKDVFEESVLEHLAEKGDGESVEQYKIASKYEQREGEGVRQSRLEVKRQQDAR